MSFSCCLQKGILLSAITCVLFIWEPLTGFLRRTSTSVSIVWQLRKSATQRRAKRVRCCCSGLASAAKLQNSSLATSSPHRPRSNGRAVKHRHERIRHLLAGGRSLAARRHSAPCGAPLPPVASKRRNCSSGLRAETPIGVRSQLKGFEVIC